MNVTERFLKYVSFDTQSDSRSDQIPSTPGQLILGAALAEELKSLGIQDAHCDEFGCVYGHIPPSKGCTRPGLALIAHMDTAMEMSGANIHPRIVENYDGGEIILNEEKHIVTRPEDFPSLKAHIGQDLIVTDGTTLLGADNKAGVAEIVTLAEFLMANPDFPHPPVCILFTPDEEIGRGTNHVNLEKLGAAYGYTVDGGILGELSYENFNAAAAHLTFHGITAHPGYAKGVLKNAMLVAMEYQSLLPVFQTPACTQDREGFFHLNHMEGTAETATLDYLIRDHDYGLFLARQELMKDCVDFLNRKYGPKTVEITITENYRNMIEHVKAHPELIQCAITAMEQTSITPVITPIRGGTDGARLSYAGLPCPNLCTGGQNGHGRHEYVSCQAMEKVTELLKNLVKLFA